MVNDSLGHDTGDSLLIAAAGVIRRSCRASDIAARIGGDEFAVLLSNSDRSIVESVISRIRKAIEAHNEQNPEIPLSISFGFAASGEGCKNITDLFKEADNNMYREKLHNSRSTRSTIVQILMKTLEARDFITEGHANRMQRHCEIGYRIAQ